MKNSVHFIPGSVVPGFILILLAIVTLNCVETPLTPVAPTSEIKLEGISIIDLTRTFADFLVKDAALTRNPDGTSNYKKSESMAPQGIPAIILQTQPSSQQVDVGQFSVNGISKNSTYPATAISPSLTGTLPGLPAGTFPVPSVPVNDTTFDYVKIAAGTLTLTITNNMPVPIDFPNPIVLHNNWTNPVDNSVIASFTIAGAINPGVSLPVTRVIDGKLLRGSLTTDPIQLHTSGSLSSVTFLPSSGLSISFQSTNLTADSASAVIPTQTVKSINDSVLVVDKLTVIKSAVFSKGKINLQLANNLGIDVTAMMSVKEMKQNGTTSYILNQTLPAKQTQNILLDFSKISIQSDSIRQYGTSIKFSVGITTIDSKGAKKTVTKNDYVKASFIPQDPLVVKSVDGKIAPTLVQINEGIKSGINAADLGDLSAQVSLKGMQLTIKLPITGGFPTDYNLLFIAKNSKKNFTNSVQLISAPNSTSFPRINPPATAVIQLSSIPGFDLDGFISGFFPDVPDSFFVRGTFTLDPQDIFAQSNTYKIYDTTKVYPSFDLNLPVAVGIKNGVIKEVLPFSKDQVPKDFTKNVGQGTLTFYFYNMLPFKMFFRANFLGNYNPLTHKADTLLRIALSDTIKPADVDVNGLTTLSKFSKVSVSLNSSQMSGFNNADSLYVRIDMSTSNNGQVVKVRDTDYIRVYAKGDITYTIGKQ